jgi:glucose-6-phosphate 1-dehydrogenase
MINENEILKMDYNVKKEIDKMDKDVDLFKQVANNYKEEEIYKLDTYKEIELKKQKIQNLQMLNFLRDFRNKMTNTNPQIN